MSRADAIQLEAVTTRSSPTHRTVYRGTSMLPLYTLHLFLLILLLRPAELFPALAPLRPVLVSFVVLAISSLAAWRTTGVTHHWTWRFAVGLSFAMALSIPSSYWVSRSLSQTANFAWQLVVLVIVLHTVYRFAALLQVIGTFVLANAFHSALLILAAARGEYENRAFGAAGSVFSDPNDLALNFVVCLPMALWLASHCRQTRLKLLFYAAALILIGGLVASQSRGGMVGALAMGCALSFGWSRKLPTVAAVGACLVIAVALAPTELTDRFSTVAEYQSDESAQSRIYVWRKGYEMWADHPVTGVGMGTYQLAYGTDYLKSDAPTNKWLAAHNSVIHVAAELGTLGLICWLGTLWGGLAALNQVRRWKTRLSHSWEGSYLAQLAVALRASLIGYVVCAMFISRAYDWIPFLLIAFCLLCWRLAIENLQEQADPPRPHELDSADDIELPAPWILPLQKRGLRYV